MAPDSSSRVAQALQLQQASCDAGSRIIQVCCVDHATGNSPSRAHLHLQVHFSNGSGASPWFQIDASLEDLRAALAALPLTPSGTAVRLHLHTQDDKPKPTEPTYAEGLPRGKLADASLLSDSESTCPVCLAAFAAGDEMVVLPCQGLHTAHWDCLQPWLATAHTCPTCRFELPTTKRGAASELVTPAMEKAWAEMHRLERPPPPPAVAAMEAPWVTARKRAEATGLKVDGLVDTRGQRQTSPIPAAEQPASSAALARPLARPPPASGSSPTLRQGSPRPAAVAHALPVLEGAPVPTSQPAAWVVAEGTPVERKRRGVSLSSGGGRNWFNLRPPPRR